jgi:hypothetical protein
LYLSPDSVVNKKEIMNIEIASVLIDNRMRKEMGDLDQLANSIKDNGLIQPIVLVEEQEEDLVHIRLIAGHRRLQALIKLGVTELEEGVHFIWRSDLANDEYRKTAVELEENIRRKSMSWSEEVLGKQRLLEVYQKIYGAPSGGRPVGAVQQGFRPAGFGVRKLAELLNESPGNTSQDLQMAALVTQIPSLKNEPSRDAAERKLKLALLIQAGKGAIHVAKPLVYKILVECNSEIHQSTLLTQFRTAGLKCQAIVA